VHGVHVTAVGAVTSIGLTAEQTCAGYRAGVSGIRRTILRSPPQEPLRAARVPARRALKRGERDWLLNLAARSIRDTLSRTRMVGQELPLILVLPEAGRNHPGLVQEHKISFLDELELRLGWKFRAGSQMLFQGRAGGIAAFSLATQLLDQHGGCLVCGVDSFINSSDIEHLLATDRLLDVNKPQGLIPGEGAACILLERTPKLALARIIGWSTAEEKNNVNGENYSTGSALAEAMNEAAARAGVSESEIAFRVSDVNGERYRAWESFLASTRFFRSHRQHLPTYVPAASMGDTGAAAGVMTVIIATMAIASGYAPGVLACCDAASEDEMRAATIIAPAAELKGAR
jgi:3-oxoacyl-[acyl-carrier-protein] synthase-1